MGIIKKYQLKHPDEFEYQKPKEVHPHDHFMDLVFLRFIPRWVTPNKITWFRFLATPIVVLTIAFGNYFVGIILFVIVAFTDAIDGSLARTRNKITKFGMMFDPLADKFLVGSLVLLLVFEYYDWWLGVALLGLEIAFIASALVVRYKFKTVHMANVWGKIKMILQVLAVFLTLSALLFNFPYLFTIGAWVFGLAIGFAVVSLFAHGV
ncbi:CDP-alcohol phosphatidyltransferase family protein [Patescibacteria group bacterium]|nr:CDP-alcohol phosphatidyltransferase family protein [Patescibacteria group bacterium]